MRFKGTRIIAGLLVLGMLCAPGAFAQKMYTAYNMWYENPQRMFSTHYKKGAMLQAGTEVKDISISGGRRPAITFKIAKNNMTCRVYFVAAHHPGVTHDNVSKCFMINNLKML